MSGKSEPVPYNGPKMEALANQLIDGGTAINELAKRLGDRTLPISKARTLEERTLPAIDAFISGVRKALRERQMADAMPEGRETEAEPEAQKKVAKKSRR
jgi:hypothetical protein